MKARTELRRKLMAGEPVVAPLCLDPLSACLVESLGFPATYLGGGALGYTYAVSEALLTLTELTSATSLVTQRVNIPVIVDGGIGFGDAVHLMRTIWAIEQAGGAAIEIEDQVAPKRAHHHKGVEHLISSEDMVAKIRVAVEARQDPGFLIIARTNAIKNEGLEAAVQRAKAYYEAGADLIMPLPRSEEELREFPRHVDFPLAYLGTLGNQSAEEIHQLGYGIIIDALLGSAVVFKALKEAYQALKQTGRAPMAPPEVFAYLDQIQTTIGLPKFWEIEERTVERHTHNP